MSTEPVFVFSDSLRHGALRAFGANDSAVSTAATAMVERLMKQRSYAEAAHVAILGRRWRSASQAMRYAVARGEIALTDLFTHELASVSYRDALPDPFLGVAVALSGHTRMIDSARDELLASGATESAGVGDSDEAELIASDSTAAEAESETKLWRSAIELVALKALNDWPGLTRAIRSAVLTVDETPKPVLARAGALRAFLAAQIELALALLGEPEYYPVERHRRLATALHASDASWVLGSVALAAAVRGEIAEAEVVLSSEYLSTDHLSTERLSTEHVSAMALIALDRRDEHDLQRDLDALARSRLSDSGLDDLRTVLDARLAYLRDRKTRAFDALRGVAKLGSLPWAHAEAVAFRIEWYLAEGLFTQAQAAINEVQRTPYARWHVIRLALAKSRFAQDQPEAGLKIAESVWVSETVTSRNHARALAIGVACAGRLGDTVRADRLQRDTLFFCSRAGLKEPYDELPPETLPDAASAGPRIRPSLPMPLERVGLSKRELAVLRALSGLNGTDDIAVTLHVSKNTVKTQLRHIYRKLGVHSRDDALSAAIDEGLL